MAIGPIRNGDVTRAKAGFSLTSFCRDSQAFSFRKEKERAKIVSSPYNTRL
jgi:hypothetical protein